MQSSTKPQHIGQSAHDYGSAISRNNRNTVIAGYVVKNKLGSGSFATVHLGVKTLEDGRTKTAAIKAIARTGEKLTKKLLDNLEMEIAILRTYRHPNIVCMHDVHKTEKHFFLMLEYCGGGDLQRLIRSRKSGRLTEVLTRRLLKDLSAGLKFLWGHELIHRDLKPQNLLLTGPLPLDEIDDVSKLDSHEEMRRKVNFPSSNFSLKIADFGFARHLQTTSLAETLCGSPLYMAPEILQHHRYDAKADLWSVGTVLFEMIAGRPPFNGENHIDLLRNIQRRAVRLPPGVKVSQECVTLLRILLNRNPLSRAGFKEFFQVSDEFVALGHRGTTSGIKSEQEVTASSPGKKHIIDSKTSLETAQASYHGRDRRIPTIVSTHQGISPPGDNYTQDMVTSGRQQATSTNQNQYMIQPQDQGILTKTVPHFTPLAPSPPGPEPKQSVALPSYFSLDDGTSTRPQQHVPLHFPISSRLTNPNQHQHQHQHQRRHEPSQSLVDENDFVLVEHGGSRSNSISPASSQLSAPSNLGTEKTYSYSRSGKNRCKSSSSKSYPLPSKTSSTIRKQHCGMLSTSPGTGRDLVAMMSRHISNKNEMDGTTNWLSQNFLHGNAQIDGTTDLEFVAKILAAAEDVGRRAVNIAHLGDTRVYFGMKSMMEREANSSLLSSNMMDGAFVESDDRNVNRMIVNDNLPSSDHHISAIENRSSFRSSSERNWKNYTLDKVPEVDEDEEMPFAVTPAATVSSNSSNSLLSTKPIVSTNSSLTNSRLNNRPTIGLIRKYFREALSCYLKALGLMKGALSAAQLVMQKIAQTNNEGGGQNLEKDKAMLMERCDLSVNWLSSQFTGVLERADAASHELKKSAAASSNDVNEHVTSSLDQHRILSVEEIVYNHSLSCGRDGAVKQLLGQYDAARACYHSAGLLAESLLMEPKISEDDCRTLEGYVDGFSERIKELNSILSRKPVTRTGSIGKGGTSGTVVGLVGGVLPPNKGFGFGTEEVPRNIPFAQLPRPLPFVSEK